MWVHYRFDTATCPKLGNEAIAVTWGIYAPHSSGYEIRITNALAELGIMRLLSVRTQFFFLSKLNKQENKTIECQNVLSFDANEELRE